MARLLFKNASLLALCRILSGAANLVLIPVIVAKLGVTGFGVWEVIGAAASWTSLADGGLGAAVLRWVSDAAARDDSRAINRYMMIGVELHIVFGAIVTGLVWYAEDWLVKLTNLPLESAASVAGLFPLVVAIMFLTGSVQCLAAVISGAQKTGISEILASGSYIAGAVVSTVGVINGFGLWALLMGQAVTLGLRFVGTVLTIWRLFPRVSLRPAMLTAVELKNLFSYGGIVQLARVVETLGQQTDKLVLAALASPTWAGYYAIAARLASLVGEFNRFICLPLIPASAALAVAQDEHALGRLYGWAMLVASLLICGIAVLVAGLNDRLIVLWFGASMPEAIWLVIGLTLAATLHNLAGPGSSICRGIGLVNLELYFVLSNAILNIILTLLLVWWYGPLGTVIASVTTFSLTSLYYFYLLHGTVDFPLDATVTAFKTLLAAIVAVIAMWAASAVLPPPQTRLQAAIVSLILGSMGTGVYAGLLLAAKIVTLQTWRDLIAHITSQGSGATQQPGRKEACP